MARLHLYICLVALVAVIGIFAWATSGSAYPQYSMNGGDNTYCGTCHGDFRAASYISLADGQDWGNLHNLHRSAMLGGDCDTCHIGGSRFPVMLDASTGGAGLAAVGCMGCHGRAEDDIAANPNPGGGAGAGLRQHHYTAGVTNCVGCHPDSNPASYTTAGEKTAPPYYANPGTGHPDMPGDCCNAVGDENFAGALQGLDNDGDGIYDFNDPDCLVPVKPSTWGAIKALYLAEN